MRRLNMNSLDFLNKSLNNFLLPKRIDVSLKLYHWTRNVVLLGLLGGLTNKEPGW